MSDETIRQQFGSAATLDARARRLELMVRCLNIPLAEDVAAMELGAKALRHLAALSAQPAPQPAETKEHEQDLSASAPARSPAGFADAGTEPRPNRGK